MTAHATTLVVACTVLAVWALTMLIAGVIELVARWRENHRKPYDWERACPELRDRQPHHVRVISFTRWS